MFDAPLSLHPGRTPFTHVIALVFVASACFGDLGIGDPVYPTNSGQTMSITETLTNAGSEDTSAPTGSDGESTAASESGTSGTGSTSEGDTTQEGSGSQGSGMTTMEATTGTSDESSTGDGTTTGSGMCIGPTVNQKCPGGVLDGTITAQVDPELSLDEASTDEIPIDVSECGDPQAKVAGLAVDVSLDGCLGDFDLDLECPSGETLTLASNESLGFCAKKCEETQATVSYAWEGGSACLDCGDACVVTPWAAEMLGPETAICSFLTACDLSGPDPWKLVVTSHDMPVHISSVALSLLVIQ